MNGGYTEARFDTTDLRDALPDDEAARAHAEKVADDFARTKLFGTAVRVTNDPGQVVCRSIVDASSSKAKKRDRCLWLGNGLSYAQPGVRGTGGWTRLVVKSIFPRSRPTLRLNFLMRSNFFSVPPQELSSRYLRTQLF